MVKVTGPAFSLDASGKLAGALVFSKWKGRNYIRRLVKPANPSSGPQRGVRAMVKFLGQIWETLSASDQATWVAGAQAYDISPFNAFCKFNLFANRNFLAPTPTHPPSRTATVRDLTNEAATAGVRQITLTFDVTSGPGTNWGVSIYRQTTTPVVTAFSNQIAVLPAATGQTDVTYVDTPLAPGSYYYNFRPFNITGNLGIEQTEVDAIVT